MLKLDLISAVVNFSAGDGARALGALSNLKQIRSVRFVLREQTKNDIGNRRGRAQKSCNRGSTIAIDCTKESKGDGPPHGVVNLGVS